ncbi:beta-aspartyl-peptidase [Cloacibacillus evryensis]|uniref:Isoaspartyl dipeptidase n=1 Tax=Cloacibacillus evryensis TaxID=508460 RepID=A0AAW5K276_9BACT|nr:beta-aspartyl-peptidase [Cloacibacillus evryensis]EHL67792.1 beta-aspartyl peptidase [Synergistes sp. 3_1_syn1]EXG78463.1 isoaspartyl dipeptidase IadA [Cloacibacillus evryensis DSM 19522]MCQ4764936.1 beta-aspartyl-peptidase [Cloacibacillus evryensis]MCQ4814925.1 beta-aspartyl-peptidase [Cloacibacillus evryensis]MEA5033927.1 beta-aspartyl-peptidase [Cloacibacillus evryensis]
MFVLIKNADVFAPEPLGISSILISHDKIAWLGKDFPAEKTLPDLEIIDAAGKIMIPGIVDGHVHVTGGGGEGGFATRTPELALSDMIKGGVTTVIGLLGTDDVTRSAGALIAKTNAIRAEGMSAWAMTGSYQLPVKSLCGGVRDDIALIEPFIGVGEVALSDHRSSQPTFEEFMRLAAAARVGGMLSGKAGVVNVHLGDAPSGLDYLFRAAKTEIPPSQFIPTHMNRNPELFKEACRYGAMGGYVDLTTSTTPQFLDEGEVECGRALSELLAAGVPARRISFSSDGQGSMPFFDEAGDFAGLTIGRVTSIFETFRSTVKNYDILFEDAVRVVSTTAADHCKLSGKGHIKEGCDADLILMDAGSLELDTLFARGRKMMSGGRPLVKGTFEQ